MREIAFTVLVLMISNAAQATAPAGRRHVQVRMHGAVHEQWRDSSAFVAPTPSAQSEGAMTSGIAGH